LSFSPQQELLKNMPIFYYIKPFEEIMKMIERFMHVGFLTLFSLLMVNGCSYDALSQDNTLKPGTHSLEIRAAGQRWSYELHIPPQYRPGQPTPLVFILHGAGGDGEIYLETTGWRRKANQEGFIAVAPNGQPSRPLFPADVRINPRVWNAGNLRGNTRRVKFNDVEFFRSLLREVKQKLTIDDRRIYVTGHSNGGGMTFMLATEMPDFAAIAPVAALYWRDKSQLAAPVSTLYMVGTKDPVIPLEGGASALSIWGNRNTPPVRDTINTWVGASGCPRTAITTNTQKGVKIDRYRPCSSNTEFLVYFIPGQGHGWPGGKTNLPESIIGPKSNQINATDVIWDFFRQHPR
jgi:polyhydroxybutyrate depolymerase